MKIMNDFNNIERKEFPTEGACIKWINRRCRESGFAVKNVEIISEENLQTGEIRFSGILYYNEREELK